MRRTCQYTALLVGMLCLAGCSSQDFSSPMGPLSDLADLTRRPAPIDPGAEAEERSRKLAAILESLDLEQTRPDRDYSLGPDDILDIGILALDEPDTVTTLNRTVGEDGTVALPLVGDVRIAGLNTRDATAHITGQYAGKYLKNPQVSVTIVEYRSAPVVITGAVGKPGMYYLRDNQSSVLEILATAGGLTEDAGDSLLIVRKKDRTQVEEQPGPEEPAPETDIGDEGADGGRSDSQQVVTVDLKGLLDDGDIRMNVPVAGGDILSVPPRRQDFFYVLGYVNRPGAFEVTSRRRVRAMQAVAMAGGLSSAARAQNSFLIREKAGEREVTPVDLTKIARGVLPPVYLDAGDTLVIGSGVLAKLGEFIKPSVGASASFSPVP